MAGVGSTADRSGNPAGGAGRRRVTQMRILSVIAALCAAVATTAAGPAEAGGGEIAFDGGTPRQQAQVRSALQASSFDWSVLRRRVTVHVAPGTDSFSTRGEVWLDGDLLDAGRLAWSTVQHELAHQVDLFLLDDRGRSTLQGILDAASWNGGGHDARGSERFAETLAAAYWPSAGNLAHAYAAPARFRAALARLLGEPTLDKRLARR